jgi:hypothetical protein
MNCKLIPYFLLYDYQQTFLQVRLNFWVLFRSFLVAIKKERFWSHWSLSTRNWARIGFMSRGKSHQLLPPQRRALQPHFFCFGIILLLTAENPVFDFRKFFHIFITSNEFKKGIFKWIILPMLMNLSLALNLSFLRLNFYSCVDYSERIFLELYLSYFLDNFGHFFNNYGHFR